MAPEAYKRSYKVPPQQTPYSKVIKNHRKSKSAEVNVKVARPGIIFGRGAVDIKYLTQEILKRTGRNYKLNIIEDKESDLSSKMVSHLLMSPFSDF